MYPISSDPSLEVKNANKNENSVENNAETRQSKLRRKTIGIVLLVFADLVWVASAEITKYLYTHQSYEKPFFMTYLRSCAFGLYLLVLCFVPSTNERNPPKSPAEYTQLIDPTEDNEDENFYSEEANGLGDSMFVPVGAGETTDSDDAVPRAVRFNKVAEVRVMSSATAREALLARLSWSAWVRMADTARRRAAARNARRHATLALAAAPPWFCANYLFRLCLLYCDTGIATSVASYSIVLATAVIQRKRLYSNIIVSLLLMLTAFIVAWLTGSKWNGILIGLGAALCHTIHILLLRYNTPTSPFFFAGLVGACGAACAWPVGGVLHATNIEHLEWPTHTQWAVLVAEVVLTAALAEPLYLWGKRLEDENTGRCIGVLGSICDIKTLGLSWTTLRVFPVAMITCLSTHLAGRNTQRPNTTPMDSLGEPRYINGFDDQSELLINPDGNALNE